MPDDLLRSMILALWPVGLAVTIGALLEWLRPWRRQNVDRLRWLHAAILFILAIVITNFILPLGHAGVALVAEGNGWGLLNASPMPAWVAIVVGVLVLDLVRWACHWLMHHSPILWRMHRLHHSDEVIDTSTAFRFHPAEVVFVFLVQIVVILACGVPVAAITVSAVLVLVFDVWEHANAKTPKVLQCLSAAVITPDLHRLHHSSDRHRQNGNLGTIFSVWDRVFGTYISGREVDDQMTFGLGSGGSLDFSALYDLLIDPLRKP